MQNKFIQEQIRAVKLYVAIETKLAPNCKSNLSNIIAGVQILHVKDARFAAWKITKKTLTPVDAFLCEKWRQSDTAVKSDLRDLIIIKHALCR